MPDDQANCLLTADPCVCNTADETPSTPALAATIRYLRAEHDRAVRDLGKRKIRTLSEAAAVARLIHDPDPAAMLHWRIAKYVLLAFETAQ